MKKAQLIQEVCRLLGIATDIIGPDHNGRYHILEINSPMAGRVALEQFWFRKAMIVRILDNLTKEAP